MIPRAHLHIIGFDTLLWRLGGFADPEYGGKNMAWTADECAELSRLWPDATLTVEQIADMVGHTKGATHMQAARIGLPRRQPNSHIGEPRRSAEAA